MELLKELDSIQLLVANARHHPVIKERLAAYGYDDIKMQQALNLLKHLQDDQHIQWDEQNKYKLLRDAMDAEIKVMRQQFTDHRALAKVALRNDPMAYHQLELHQDQEKEPLPCMEQAELFYEVATIHQKALARFGLTESEVEQGAAMLKSIKEKRQEIFKHKGSAQHATHIHNQVLHSLRSWHRSFKVVAKVALEKEPQLLESLGIMIEAK